MAFIEKATQFLTGKTAIERRQESAANQIIRQKANSAALRERETQAIRLAVAREKVSYDRKISALNQPPRQYGSPMNGAFGNMFGVAQQKPQAKSRIVVRTRYKPVKRGKKIIYKKVRTRTQSMPKIAPQQRYDAIGSGFSGSYRVI